MVGGPDSVPDFLKEEEQMVGGPDSVPDFLKEEEPVTVEEPMVGGPDSVPDFLKEEEPELIVDEPMVGGPDSVPDFLKDEEPDMSIMPVPEEPDMSIQPVPEEPDMSIQPVIDEPDQSIEPIEGKPEGAKKWNDAEHGQMMIGGWEDEEPMPTIDEPEILIDEPEILIDEPEIDGGWTPDFLKEPEVVLDPRENYTGDYVIDGYEGNKNDWHYVNISWDSATEEFTWSNRAGVQWTLRETDYPNVLEVGEDCPYYTSGHTEASVVFNEDGSVKSIAGPWNEIYLK